MENTKDRMINEEEYGELEVTSRDKKCSVKVYDKEEVGDSKAIFEGTNDTILFCYVPPFIPIGMNALQQATRFCRVMNAGDPEAYTTQTLSAIVNGHGIGEDVWEAFKNHGVEVEKKVPGIYLFRWEGWDMRIVVSGELVGNEYVGFRVLGRNVSKEDILLFYRQSLFYAIFMPFLLDDLHSVLTECRCLSRKAFDELIEEGLITYDEDYEVNEDEDEFKYYLTETEGREEDAMEDYKGIIEYLVSTGEFTQKQATRAKATLGL